MQSIDFFGGNYFFSVILPIVKIACRGRPPAGSSRESSRNKIMDGYSNNRTNPPYCTFSSACAVFGLLLFRCASTIVPRVLLSEICPCLAVASFDITCRSPFIKVLKRGKSQQMFVYNSRRRIIIIETNVIHSFVLTLNTFDGFVFYDV